MIFLLPDDSILPDAGRRLVYIENEVFKFRFKILLQSQTVSIYKLFSLRHTPPEP